MSDPPNPSDALPWVDTVVHGDAVQLIQKVPAETVHLILSDIPYGMGADDWDVLHGNTNSAYMGTSPAQREAGAIFKRRGKPINGWSDADRRISQEYQAWCGTWAAEWYRILTPGASAFVFAGRRMQHRCVVAMEDAGFSVKDMLSWLKPRAPHRAQRLSVVYERRQDARNAEEWAGWRLGNLRPTFEPILWFVKPYQIGTTIADNVLKYGVGAYNERAFKNYSDSISNVLDIGFRPGESGLHPTQKPIDLMKAIIDLVTTEGHVVLDPFAGSGSTLVAAQESGRRFLGFEADERFASIAGSRLSSAVSRLW
jgi:site-specific DNA-methyltransferase (adenine-specific)